MIHLQTEPKTTSTDNIYLEALVNIIYTYQYTGQQIRDLLEPYDITQQQYNVLRILKGQYPSPCTINLIKSKILDKMCDVSRIVDRLMYKGYIEKTINNYDKRAVDIVLAEKGLALLKKVAREVDFSMVIAPKLSAEEVDQLNYLLSKVRVKI
jgi:DNA-binding MarR family transcriptional regulator